MFPLVLLSSACSSMLPNSHTESTSFASYEEARDAIEKLEPMKSDKTTLN